MKEKYKEEISQIKANPFLKERIRKKIENKNQRKMPILIGTIIASLLVLVIIPVNAEKIENLFFHLGKTILHTKEGKTYEYENGIYTVNTKFDDVEEDFIEYKDKSIEEVEELIGIKYLKPKGESYQVLSLYLNNYKTAGYSTGNGKIVTINTVSQDFEYDCKDHDCYNGDSKNKYITVATYIYTPNIIETLKRQEEENKKDRIANFENIDEIYSIDQMETKDERLAKMKSDYERIKLKFGTEATLCSTEYIYKGNRHFSYNISFTYQNIFYNISGKDVTKEETIDFANSLK